MKILGGVGVVAEVGVFVGSVVSAGVEVGVRLALGVLVGADVVVAVGVNEGAPVGVGVRVAVAVGVLVVVAVSVAVADAVGEAVGVGVRVAVAVGVAVGVYTVPVPWSLISPTRLPAKLLVPTTVRWHAELLMFRPYDWVLSAWLSVAVFESMTLSSQVTPLPDWILIPSRPARSSELFKIVLPVT